MNQGLRSSRLVVEIATIVAAVEVAVLCALSALVPDVASISAMLANAALLALVAGPAIFWRLSMAPQVKGATHDRSLRAAITLAAATQVAGLALTASGVAWLRDTAAATAQGKFDTLADRIEVAIQRRFTQPVYGLNGLAGFCAGSKSVERGEFRAFVASRNLAAEFPGVSGFGFVQRVTRDDLNHFIATERADEAPEFSVHSCHIPDDHRDA